ncbi:MAG: hypothetical protein KBT00_00790 [Bacteroidales bacterium]|nr:hypothetical protein [Candidatus Cacconaster merdequi]
MKLLLSYKEISLLLLRKTNQQFNFSTVSSDTVEISYRKGILTPSVKLTVDSIEGSMVNVSYDGSFGVGAAVKAALSAFRSKLDGFIIEIPHTDSLSIDLSRLKGAQKVLEHLSLQSLSFEGDNAVIGVEAKI